MVIIKILLMMTALERKVMDNTNMHHRCISIQLINHITNHKTHGMISIRLHIKKQTDMSSLEGM